MIHNLHPYLVIMFMICYHSVWQHLDRERGKVTHIVTKIFIFTSHASNIAMYVCLPSHFVPSGNTPSSNMSSNHVVMHYAPYTIQQYVTWQQVSSYAQFANDMKQKTFQLYTNISCAIQQLCTILSFSLTLCEPTSTNVRLACRHYC